MSLSGFFKSRRPETSSLPPAPTLTGAETKDGAPAPPPSPAVDFVAVLTAAGVTQEQRTKVQKAQELLRTLPPDTPALVKRAIVEAAFKAFDVPTQEIVAAASAEIEALKAFGRTGEEHTQRILAEGNQQIKLLEAKIAEVTASMNRAVAEQAMRAEATVAKMHEVQPVLQFFTPESPAPQPQEARNGTAGAGSENGASDGGVEVQWEADR
ncbi:uncharacterized protein SOCE26_039430 [Sorangium cellulosum]|uniref:Uncharacterized protein n=1 Tax=Sorangium cellulosum TaxID=56 RepID=A0A2L0ET92_SORCE|nr:hypothetical protein [Sorangium cellulosum]AUX42510.1 uncharacterized protein SOCE26_039430 [Sorangium cellulosum]